MLRWNMISPHDVKDRKYIPIRVTLGLGQCRCIMACGGLEYCNFQPTS